MMVWEKETWEASDIEISAKIGKNWKLVIPLLFPSFYKIRKQPKSKKIHSKMLQGIQPLPFLFYLEWNLTEAWISFWLLFTSQQHHGTGLLQGTSSRKEFRKELFKYLLFFLNQLCFSKMTPLFPAKSLWNNKKKMCPNSSRRLHW